MPTLTLTQVRAGLADLVAGVQAGGAPVVLTRHGAPVAALVSVEELAALQEMQAAASRLDQARRRSAG